MKNPVRERLADLADELDQTADGLRLRGWGVTCDRMKAAANSIRWQLRWDEKHPPKEA